MKPITLSYYKQTNITLPMKNQNTEQLWYPWDFLRLRKLLGRHSAHQVQEIYKRLRDELAASQNRQSTRVSHRLLAKLAVAKTLQSAGICVLPKVYMYNGKRSYGYAVHHRTATGGCETGNIQWTFDNALLYAFHFLAPKVE